MNKLWVFGDSFSQEFDKQTDLYSRNGYLKFKGYTPKNYSNLLSEHLNYELLNHASEGLSNYQIFENFCRVVQQINGNDVVIFGWSEITRYRLVVDTTHFHTVGTWYIGREDLPIDGFGVSRKSLEEHLFNRLDNLKCYYDEVHQWINLINHTLKLKNVKVIHWSPQEQVGFNVPQYHDMETIKMETDGLIDDSHYSEQGHHQLYTILKDELKKIKNFI